MSAWLSWAHAPDLMCWSFGAAGLALGLFADLILQRASACQRRLKRSWRAKWGKPLDPDWKT